MNNKTTSMQVSFKIDGQLCSFYTDTPEQASKLLGTLKEAYSDSLTGITIEEVNAEE